MTNTRAKGTRKEHDLLQEFKAHMAKNKAYKHVAEWRSVAQAYNNTDLFSDFDIMLAYDYNSQIQVWFAIQVKSKFSPKYYKYLQSRWKDAPVKAYLAVYDRAWKGRVNARIQPETIKLPGFRLIRV